MDCVSEMSQVGSRPRKFEAHQPLPAEIAPVVADLRDGAVALSVREHKVGKRHIWHGRKMQVRLCEKYMSQALDDRLPPFDDNVAAVYALSIVK
jgi:hypothetical protein